MARARPADRWYFLLARRRVLLASIRTRCSSRGSSSRSRPSRRSSSSSRGSSERSRATRSRDRSRTRSPSRPPVGSRPRRSSGCTSAPSRCTRCSRTRSAAPVVAPLLGLGSPARRSPGRSPAAATRSPGRTAGSPPTSRGARERRGRLPFAQVTSGVRPCRSVAVASWSSRSAAAAASCALVGLAAMAASLVVGWKLLLAPRAPPPPPPAGLRVTFLDVGQGDADPLEVPEGAILVDQGRPRRTSPSSSGRLGVRPPRRRSSSPTRSATTSAGPRRSSTSRRSASSSIRASPTRAPTRRRRCAARARECASWPPARASGSGSAGSGSASSGRTSPALRATIRTSAPSSCSPPTARRTCSSPRTRSRTSRCRSDLPPVEILKVAHHGSADDGLPDLLRRTRPEVAVISVGERNDYGHPTPEHHPRARRGSGPRDLPHGRGRRVVVESDGRRLIRHHRAVTTMLASCPSEPLLPAYLLTGSDRPKIGRAVARLRGRFPVESVELLTADAASGADAVAACNALGLFGDEGAHLVVVEGVERWKAEDVEAVVAYLAEPPERTSRPRRRRRPSTTAARERASERGARCSLRRPEAARPVRVGARGVRAPRRAGRRRHGARARRDRRRRRDRARERDRQDRDVVGRRADRAAGGREPRRPPSDTFVWALTGRVGRARRPRRPSPRARPSSRANREPFAIAAALASYVGRVRAAQAMAEEGLGDRGGREAPQGSRSTRRARRSATRRTSPGTSSTRRSSGSPSSMRRSRARAAWAPSSSWSGPSSSSPRRAGGGGRHPGRDADEEPAL